jgi:asparagine synthase (glutamine-hydrolysing)
VLPWPEADERAWIAAAAARWNLSPRLIDVPVGPAAHGLAAIRAHRDLPDFPRDGPMLAPLHEALRADGVDVVLTGFGGDQWWSGEWTHMADLLKRGQFGDLRVWRRAGASMGEIEWSWPAFVQEGIFPLVPPAARALARQVRPARLPAWIDAGFAARAGLRERLGRRPDTRTAPSESWRRLRWRLDSGDEAQLIERLDRIAVAHGVDLRHPLYDRRLVDLAFSIPGSAHIEAGRNRAIMRGAMRDRLSHETHARVTKADLSALLVDAARAPDVEPHLRLPMLSDLGWIDRPGAALVIDRVVTHGDREWAGVFWSIIGVEAWLREVFGAE